MSRRATFRACFSGKNVLTTLMLCWMAQNFFGSCFLPPELADPMAQMLQWLAGIRIPNDSRVGRWSLHVALPPICTEKHPSKLLIQPYGIFTWLDDNTSNTACPKMKQSSSPKGASLLIPQARAPGICCLSFPPLGGICFLNVIDMTVDQKTSYVRG